MKILHVDDSPIQHRIIRGFLDTPEFGEAELFFASNGEEALKTLEKQHIDLILLDWNMPKLPGIEVVRQVRGNQDFDSIKIIMLTALSGKDFVLEAIQEGVDAYIVKPPKAEEVQEKIRKALNL
jgi:two-component system chemotaxis response regulator CheY